AGAPIAGAASARAVDRPGETIVARRASVALHVRIYENAARTDKVATLRKGFGLIAVAVMVACSAPAATTPGSSSAPESTIAGPQDDRQHPQREARGSVADADGPRRPRVLGDIRVRDATHPG